MTGGAKQPTIGPSTILNFGRVGNEACASIGQGAWIGAFCIVEPGAVIGDDVEVFHHCVIGRGAKIGPRTKLVDRLRVAKLATVGADCILGGNVSERTIIEDRVTFMGEMAHSHRDASLDWDTTDEPSPIIRTGTVVAQGAWIIGGITVGPNCYISAGEIVKTDVPPGTVVIDGKRMPIERWRGLIRTRGLDRQ